MGIPALDRGLDILDTLITKNRPLKYSELKKSIPGISDSSLNRLLTSLLEKSYIYKDDTGNYIPGENIKRWDNIFTSRDDILERLQIIIENIVTETNESAAIGMLKDNKIEIVASKSAENSISIIGVNDTLYFEEDHAGSLAILNVISQEERVNCISSEYSRINNMDVYNNSINKFYKSHNSVSYYFDESLHRRGISRLALPFEIDNIWYSLFLCAPTMRLKSNELSFLNILKDYI